jgi:hypothetical protein
MCWRTLRAMCSTAEAEEEVDEDDMSDREVSSEAIEVGEEMELLFAELSLVDCASSTETTASSNECGIIDSKHRTICSSTFFTSAACTSVARSRSTGSVAPTAECAAASTGERRRCWPASRGSTTRERREKRWARDEGVTTTESASISGSSVETVDVADSVFLFSWSPAVVPAPAPSPSLPASPAPARPRPCAALSASGDGSDADGLT